MTFSSTARDERGIALLSTILTVLLITAIGMALMYASTMDTLINANYRDKQMAQYASVSGVQEARDRIQPSNVVAPITAPTSLPASGATNVIYLVNPSSGETVQPWNTANAYFDTDLCHENVFGLSGTPGVPCTTTATGTWYSVINDTQSTSAPWNIATPLPTKWTRIMLKANNMGLVPVNGNSSDATQICWDGKQQVTLPAGYVGSNCGPSHKVLTVVVTNAGTGYTAQPVITIDPPGGSGTQATATSVWQSVPNGQINSITVNNGGSGYTSAPTVTITGGGGSGATAVATIVNGGAPVISLNLQSAGQQCYASAPSVSISGGGGSGATGTATLNAGFNCIYSMTVGANCPKNENITFSVSGGGGSGLVLSTYHSPAGSGNFSGVNLPIVNPGTGYTGSALTVTAAGTSRACTGVTATAAFGHFVNALTLVSGGAGYTSVPTVTLGGGTGSGVSGATGTATLGTPPANSTTVTLVTVTNPGSGYTSAPTVSFSGGGGTGATATASIGAIFKLIVGAQTITNNGSGYTSVPTVTISRGPGDTTGTGAQAYATVDGASGLTYGMVYQLTSLAVTKSGARAMTQMEVATPVRGLALTSALTLAGPQPVIDQLPNSTNFYIDGNDGSDGSNVTRAAHSTVAPTPPGCTTTPNATRPAVGGWDDPNSPTTYQESSVDIIKSDIPAGRTNNYMGSGPSPDVQNVYGSLGDTLTSTTGLKDLLDAVKSAAGANVFASNADISGSLGSVNNPVIDYVDGDVTLQGNNTGYGILVVTGTLNMGGNFSWNGLVLVIGDGAVNFQGGGNGQINGQVFVSKMWDSYTTKNLLSAPGAPSLSWNGGGGNGIFYNHCWADDMLGKFPFIPPPPTKQLKVLSTRTVTY